MSVIGRRLAPTTSGRKQARKGSAYRIGEHVGQRNLAVTANTYTHVLVDEAELDYASLLA